MLGGMEVVCLEEGPDEDICPDYRGVGECECRLGIEVKMEGIWKVEVKRKEKGKSSQHDGGGFEGEKRSWRF